jgi:hypothetical protein
MHHVLHWLQVPLSLTTTKIVLRLHKDHVWMSQNVSNLMMEIRWEVQVGGLMSLHLLDLFLK